MVTVDIDDLDRRRVQADTGELLQGTPGGREADCLRASATEALG